MEGFPLDKLHTSGHADISAIKLAVEITQPEVIIPIHTEAPQLFRQIAGDRKVLLLNDGEAAEI